MSNRISNEEIESDLQNCHGYLCSAANKISGTKQYKQAQKVLAELNKLYGMTIKADKE